MGEIDAVIGVFLPLSVITSLILWVVTSPFSPAGLPVAVGAYVVTFLIARRFVRTDPDRPASDVWKAVGGVIAAAIAIDLVL